VRSSLLAILFVGLGLTGCRSCSETANTTVSIDAGGANNAPPDDAAVATVDKRGPDRAPGQVGMLTNAARALALTGEQRMKIDAAEKLVKPDLSGSGSRDELSTLNADLVSGVKAGKLDEAKIEADLKAIEQAAKDRSDKEATALNAIYAALEPAQRAQAVEKVRNHNEMVESKRAEQKRLPRPPEISAQKRMEGLTRDLGLDAEQEGKAQAAAAALPTPAPVDDEAEAKKRNDAVLAAFEKDGFDATKLEAQDTKRARRGAEQNVKLVAALLPILKPEQREKLAARVERQMQTGRGRTRGPHPTGSGNDDETQPPNAPASR
jgi:Spy/CpxP family protein refolding chaperone